MKAAADEINGWPNGEAAAFPISAYNKAEISRVFAQVKQTWPSSEIRVCVYNTGHRVGKPFLELTQNDIGMQSRNIILN